VVGGTTAIQGASRDTQGSTESLVRNVDGLIFGHQHARAMIDLPASITSQRGGKTLQGILDDIETGEVTAFYVHLAEGRRDNTRSVEEFTHLTDLQALTTATVIIHGSALTRNQLGDAKDAGARLVWSPQSNLRLYGQTTRAADAIDLKLPIALGADWLPSGSTSLLAEMKVARHELANQGTTIAANTLVAMVTTGAAAVAGLADRLGSLEVGRSADLVVLARNDTDAYESVCDSTPADVELVLIGGNIVYGRTDWTRQLAADPGNSILEPVIAWGRQMLLDTSYQGQHDDNPTPRLEQLRAVNAYPHVGPIWA
jgi:5-methylthioadenosine/S-adenosylhomocysteine deaminase